MPCFHFQFAEIDSAFLLIIKFSPLNEYCVMKCGLCMWLDLFQLMKKHVCDGRWEVRDSTLEFVTQLTANLKGIVMVILPVLSSLILKHCNIWKKD